ncbi:recombinase zinc beta ribbon domain-containing protein [Candidatus Saganbacteria bacterium]|nr:recombinase zinc beta ribbon domain-containing protein [Candidatus Saganbacteria bacterium]
MFVQKPGTRGKEGYRYYVCANAQAYHSCSQKYIDGNLLEEKIFTQIRAVSKRPELIRDYVVNYKREQTEEKAVFKKRAVELNRQITAFKKKEDKIINWLSETLPDRLTTKRMEQQLKGLSEKRKSFEEELLILEAKAKNLTLDEITADLISGYLERFDFYYERFTPAQRKLLLESVVQKVKVESKEKIHLYLTLPLSPLGQPLDPELAPSERSESRGSKWHPIWRVRPDLNRRSPA